MESMERFNVWKEKPKKYIKFSMDFINNKDNKRASTLCPTASDCDSSCGGCGSCSSCGGSCDSGDD